MGIILNGINQEKIINSQNEVCEKIFFCDLMFLDKNKSLYKLACSFFK